MSIGLRRIPGAKALEQLSVDIEFIRLITSKDGLKEVLDQIQAEKQEVEDKRLEAETIKSANEKLIAELKISKDENEKASRNAQFDRDNANDLKNEAERKLVQANKARDSLENDQKEFAKSVKDQEQSLQRRSEELEKRFNLKEKDLIEREERAKKTQEQADEKKALYEAKLSDLKKITG